MKQTSGQPICITSTDAARQPQEPSQVTLVTKLKFAAKRRMRLETGAGNERLDRRSTSRRVNDTDRYAEFRVQFAGKVEGRG
jgi:hypothetical protein